MSPVSFLLVLLLASCPAWAADTIELTTGWRFQAADNEAFAAASFNDQAWPTVERALSRSWRLANPRVRGGFVWYRGRFAAPGNLVGDTPTVVEIEDDRTLDKMFLNGQPLQPSWMTEVMTGRKSPSPASYVVPKSLLKPQDNVLALRVRDFDILHENHVGGVTLRRPTTGQALNVGLKTATREGKDGCEVAIGNPLGIPTNATLICRVEDYFGKARREKRQEVQLGPRGVERVFLPIESGSDYKVVAWAEWRGERGPESWEYLDPTERFGLRDALRLKGPWEFRPVTQAEGFKLPAPGDGWKPVTLPHVLKGAENLPTHRAWYRLRLETPQAMQGKRLALWLPSVRYRAEVFVNGQKAATKPNWELPDEIELAIPPGATSLELLLGVTDYIAGLAPELPEPKDGQHGVPTRGVIAATPVLPGGYSMGFDEVPELRAYPAVRVASVAVRTFVEAGKRLRVTTKLRNASSEPRRVAVIQAVLERGKLAKRLPEWAVEIKPQAEAEFTTEAEWPDAKLWGPESPVLYQLSTRLEADGQPMDEHHVRFGFREFGIRGAQFTLNGSTFRPWGASHWYPRLQPRQAEVFNCSRLFFPGHREQWVSVFDEIGAVVTQESGFGANNADSYALEDDRLYANLLGEFRRVIAHRFNHPSVMFWNQGNELRWYESKGAAQKLGDLADAMKALDPTRIVTQDRGLDLGGRLRVYNPHGLAQDVGVTPVDMRWFVARTQDIPPIVKQRRSLMLGERKPWQCAPQWDFEKPVFEGEGLYATEGRELGGWWLGDVAYLPEPIDWRPLAIRLWADRLREMYHETYRQAGVSGFLGHVWGGAGAKKLNRCAVFLKEKTTRFWAGERFVKTLTVHHDHLASEMVEVRWRLTGAGQAIGADSAYLSLEPGEIREMPAEAVLPAVQEPAEGQLTLQVRCRGSLAYDERIRIVLCPRRAPQVPFGLTVGLYDPLKQTSAALERAGLAFQSVTRLDESALMGLGLLIVGDDAADATFVAAMPVLRKLVQAGLKLLVLHQTKLPVGCWPMDVKDSSWKSVGVSAAMVAPSHPVLAGLLPEDLRWWAGADEGIVFTNALERPVEGNFTALLAADESALSGSLEFTPLAEITEGRGWIVLSQLRLAPRLTAEPAALRLLQNILDYAAKPRPPLGRAALLAAPNAPLARLLAGGCGLSAEPIPEQSRVEWRAYPVVVVDGQDSPKRSDLGQRGEELARFVSNGGSLWVVGITPAVAEWLKAHFGITARVESAHSTQAVKVALDLLLAGLTNSDFLWKWDARNEKPLTGRPADPLDVGCEALTVEPADKAIALLQPGYLVKARVGRGSVLLDNVRWADVPSRKARRVLCALATNLGLELGGAQRGDVQVSESPAGKVDVQHFWRDVTTQGFRFALLKSLEVSPLRLASGQRLLEHLGHFYLQGNPEDKLAYMGSQTGENANLATPIRQGVDERGRPFFEVENAPAKFFAWSERVTVLPWGLSLRYRFRFTEDLTATSLTMGAEFPADVVEKGRRPITAPGEVLFETPRGVVAFTFDRKLREYEGYWVTDRGLRLNPVRPPYRKGQEVECDFVLSLPSRVR